MFHVSAPHFQYDLNMSVSRFGSSSEDSLICEVNSCGNGVVGVAFPRYSGALIHCCTARNSRFMDHENIISSIQLTTD